MSDQVNSATKAEASRKIEVPFYLEPKDSAKAEAAPRVRDNYVLAPGPGEIFESGLPWIIGSFSIIPYLDALKAKAKVAALELKVKAGEAAVKLEARALGFISEKLAEIPAKPNFDDEGTLRQFNPIVKMQVEQAWKSLTARQKVDVVLSKDPDAKVSVKRPPEEPPQFWAAAAARALLLEAEMPQMGGGLEEAAGRMRLASEFAKLGLFQRAADSSLEAAIIFEKKERIKGTAAHVYDKVSAYAESAGNVAQAADAMRESERVRIALEIEKALQADGTLGKMKIELPELKSRLAEIVAREAVEEPALLARLVEYPEGSDGKAQVPTLKEGWRAHVGAMLKDGMASLLDRDSVSLLSSRGGFASDRLAIDRLVRFAQADEQMRKTLGNLADPELKSLCTELYLRYKSMSEIEKDAGEFAHKFRKGYVENVARTALWFVKEEVERRLSAMNEKGVEAVKGHAKKPGEAVTKGKFRGVKGK